MQNGGSMPLETRPSKKQKELLNYLDGFITGHGYGPSYREIMRALNYKSVSTVAVHVNGLIAKGWVRKRDRSARSLEVVAGAEPVASSGPVQSAQEKWLVDLVTERFDAYAKSPSTKKRDDLFVLVGALHVLGLVEPAAMFKARLKELK